MATRVDRPIHRNREDVPCMPCLHGWLYTASPNVLGALPAGDGSAAQQLRRIHGVTVSRVDGVISALFAPILLPEVAAVMRPLASVVLAKVPRANRRATSARAQTPTGALAAQRGRIR